MLPFTRLGGFTPAVRLALSLRSGVGDAVGLDLLGREVGGHVDRHLRELELLGRLPAGVPADDHASATHHDGLAEAELADALRDGVHSVVVQAGVLLVGIDAVDVAQLDVHRARSPG